MRGGQIVVEQQPGIFREVSSDVDAIEERTAVCTPLGRPMPHSVPVAVGVSLAEVGADV
jgi:hypothetical protein